MARKEEARSAGATAVRALRQQLAERAAAVLRQDPELRSTAIEVGLVDRAWVDEPGEHPVRTSSPVEVVQRFLERSIERKPSVLGGVGLSAIQLLAAGSTTEDGGSPIPIAITFTDLEGFTSFTASEGDEHALDLLAQHHRTVGPIVRSRGGRVVKRIGDGLMLSFPSPEAAVHAALELVDAPPPPLRLRAGVHCGEAVVSGDDLIGHDVNVAARVADAATGGAVLTTVELRDAVGPLRDVAFGIPESLRLKGLDDPVDVCAVSWR
ncbi:MAG: hypothetical protein AVDCRST_MAG20-761 [uncultured Acidimicrobiales bacterium]|uniref:Guanylate cyclase domain-containing protein n=1 Tax=uncultured Acidimicrobiales bacterium TaxID=310071 RepID=A0A6J4HJJ4_9ACTN|nr:MAG: hypothetical protein AVDCRST_MAG20-761 [uncultured Acidimicrobiales bacterium]